jgi:broad specificity phosphatase PhoE
VKKISIPRLPFYFIRHGQTDWNKEGRIMGQADIPLNEIGIKQAHRAIEHIAHLEISVIISSPLKRALKTSEIIASRLNVSITVINELQEACAGSLEARLKDEEGLWLEHWQQGLIEGAEPWADFVARVAAGLTAALKDKHNQKPILIVAHGGVWRAMREILQFEAEDISNCCPIFFEPLEHNDSWNVQPLLSTSHNIE